MKVVLLVAYIVLGSVALKRGRTRAIRIAAFAAALATIGFLVTVARAHHPLGLFAGRLGAQARRRPRLTALTEAPGACCYGWRNDKRRRDHLAGLRAHHLFAGLSRRRCSDC